MKVTLLSHTANPVETLNAVWQASRDNEPVDCNNSDPGLFDKVINSKIPVAEMLDFVFLLEDVSISLREQLVRHRVGVKVDGRLGADLVPDLADSVWWSQSMRVLDMGEFARNGEYHIPESILANDEATEVYRDGIYDAAQAYQRLAALGIPLEDARNVIPLGATHRLVWKLNLSALMHIIGKRGCWILQGGLWGDLVKGMVESLVPIHPAFKDLITPPCIQGDQFKGCLFKLDNEKRIKGEDPLPPCALFLNHHEEAAKYAITKGGPWQWNSEKDSFQSTPGRIAKFDDMCDKYSELWGRDPLTGVRTTTAEGQLELAL